MKDVLNGRFSIIETVSENRLYKAVDTATGNMAAVKKWVNEDGFYEAEVEALISLKHLNVPQIICAFEEDGCKYVAEEWLEGTLLKRIDSSENIVNLAVTLAEFVSAITSQASSPRTHGDIKPSNLIVCDGKIYFIDFECSVLLEESCQKETKETVRITGKYFTAPEVFYGKQSIQSDIYSIGAVVAWLLGGVDEQGINLSCIETDSRIKAIIKKCTAYKEKDRYSSADDLLEDLSNLKISEKRPVIKSCLPKNKCAESFSLYVDCNVFFAWETAVAASKYFGMKVCIIAVTDRTQRKLIYYADTKCSYGAEMVEDETVPYLFNSESIFERTAESWLEKGLINTAVEHANTLYYSGARFPGEAESDNKEFLERLVKWGKENFDCTVFVTDRYDDKPSVKYFSSLCDFTIATPLANIDDVEACKDYYERFGGQVLYAAWEFNRKTSLPEKSIKIIVGEDNYLGVVSHNDEKEYKRNFASKIQPIFKSECKDEMSDYIKIINRLFQIMSSIAYDSERGYL